MMMMRNKVTCKSKLTHMLRCIYIQNNLDKGIIMIPLAYKLSLVSHKKWKKK